jgi:hypothetical protein
MLNALGRSLSARFFQHPILIVGTGRSGTSVLLQAMGSHPDIYALPGEAPFLTTIGGAAYLFEDAENRSYYLDSLKVTKTYLFGQLRRLGFEVAAGPHFGLKRSLKGIVGRSASPLRRRFWCAKSFPSEPVTRGLLSLYPTIKFIYIVRNGCDVVQSRTKFKGFTHQGFKQHCLNWAEGVDKYRHLTGLTESCLVTQEALLDDPDALFTRLFQFLGLSDHPGAADYARTTLVHPLDKSTRTGTDAREALAKREAAHTDWSDDQRAMFKEICGPAMAELGYRVPF